MFVVLLDQQLTFALYLHRLSRICYYELRPANFALLHVP